MTDDEVRELLSVAAGYDSRETGDADVAAWAQALDDPRAPNIGLEEAVDAVIVHYRDNTDRIMPAHVLTYVKTQRRANMARLMPAHPADPAAYARVGQLWRRQYADAEAARKARRAAVLAHPDLAERLTQPPLSYAKAEQWNGGIPPKHSPEDAGGRVKPNDSPRRAALVEICEEAHRRTALERTPDA